MDDIVKEIFKIAESLTIARVKSVDSATDPDTGVRSSERKSRDRSRQNKKRTGDSSSVQKRERSDTSGLSTRDASDPDAATSDEKPF